MSIFKRLFGYSSRPNVVPRQYDWPVDKGYRDEAEQRVFADVPRLRQVRDLYEKNSLEAAWQICCQQRSETPDLDLVYDWGGACLMRMQRRHEARAFLLEGIEHSKRKCTLLCQLGEMSVDDSDAAAMLIWFSNAILAQAYSPTHHTEYLYFAEIAIGCLEEDIAQSARNIANKINPGVDLKAQEKNHIRQLANPHREEFGPILQKLADLTLASVK